MVVLLGHGQQQVVHPVVQQRLVGEGARCDHPHHLAFDRALLVAGSPVCSAIATETPALTSRAR